MNDCSPTPLEQAAAISTLWSVGIVWRCTRHHCACSKCCSSTLTLLGDTGRLLRQVKLRAQVLAGVPS